MHPRQRHKSIHIFNQLKTKCTEECFVFGRYTHNVVKCILALSIISKGPFLQTLFLSISDIYGFTNADYYLIVVSFLSPFSDTSS